MSVPGSHVAARAFRHPLISGSVLLTFGTFASGVLNFAFQFAMARVLSIGAFGDLSALFAIFSIAAVPIGTLTFLTARVTAEHFAAGLSGHLRPFFFITARVVFAWAAVGVVLLITIARPVTTFFHIASLVTYTIMMAGLLPPFLLAIARGYLQGCHRFGVYAWSAISEAIAKLVVGVGLSMASFGTIGAALGVAIAPLIGTIILLPWLRLPPAVGAAERFSARGAIRRSAPTLLTFTALAVLLQLDLLAVKHWFPPEVAGAYSGIAILGRVIFFFGVSVTGALIPIAAASRQRRDGMGARSLLLAVGLVNAVGAIAIAIDFVAGGFVVQVLLGASFRPLAWLLPWYAMTMVALTVTHLLTGYLLSVRARLTAPVLWGGLVVEVVILSIFHRTLTQVVIGMALTFVACSIVLARCAWGAHDRSISTPGRRNGAGECAYTVFSGAVTGGR